VDLALSALFQAADMDSATGAPDLVRGIFPIVATITTEGFTRLEDREVAERFLAMASTLSPATAAPREIGPGPDSPEERS
jgi:proteasome beta subunit